MHKLGLLDVAQQDNGIGQCGDVLFAGAVSADQRLVRGRAQTGDLALMRELNERIVLNLIRQSGPISRAELARRSRLSRSTVSSTF